MFLLPPLLARLASAALSLCVCVCTCQTDKYVINSSLGLWLAHFSGLLFKTCGSSLGEM